MQAVDEQQNAAGQRPERPWSAALKAAQQSVQAAERQSKAQRVAATAVAADRSGRRLFPSLPGRKAQDEEQEDEDEEDAKVAGSKVKPQSAAPKSKRIAKKPLDAVGAQEHSRRSSASASASAPEGGAESEPGAKLPPVSMEVRTRAVGQVRASCSVAALVAAYRAMPPEAQQHRFVAYVLAVRAVRLLMELPEGAVQEVELPEVTVQRLAAVAAAASAAATAAQKSAKSLGGLLGIAQGSAGIAQKAAAACAASVTASADDNSAATAAAAAAAAAVDAVEAAVAAILKAQQAAEAAATTASSAESQAKVKHLLSLPLPPSGPSSSPVLLSRPIRPGSAVRQSAADDLSRSATTEELQALHAVLQECLEALLQGVPLGRDSSKESSKRPAPQQLAAVLLALADLIERLRGSVADPKRSLHPSFDTKRRLTAVLCSKPFLAEAANRGWPKPVQGDQAEVAGTHLLSPILSAASIVAPSAVMPVRSDSLVREYSWNEEEWAAGRVKFARALCMGLGMLKQDEKAKEVQASPSARPAVTAVPTGVVRGSGGLQGAGMGQVPKQPAAAAPARIAASGGVAAGVPTRTVAPLSAQGQAGPSSNGEQQAAQAGHVAQASGAKGQVKPAQGSAQSQVKPAEGSAQAQVQPAQGSAQSQVKPAESSDRAQMEGSRSKAQFQVEGLSVLPWAAATEPVQRETQQLGSSLGSHAQEQAQGQMEAAPPLIRNAGEADEERASAAATEQPASADLAQAVAQAQPGAAGSKIPVKAAPDAHLAAAPVVSACGQAALR